MNEENVTAVFGGTFDPVHSGHVGLAEYLLENGHAARIVFLPAPHPPHKPGPKPAPFADRAAMLRAAIAGRSGMSVSEMEAERSGPSYTVDTLDILKRRYPAERLVWVIGTDSLNQLHLWHEAERLVRENSFLAYPRPDAEADLPLLRSVWPPELFEKLRVGILRGAPEFETSSTGVRERLEKHGLDACREMVPAPVLDYIEEHNLYLQAKGDMPYMNDETETKKPKLNFKVLDVIELCEKVAYDHKAEHILRLDMTKQDGAIGDYYLICTGLSEPHIGAIAERIQRAVREESGIHPITLDGTPQSQWIIVDFGFLLIHVMTNETRDRYQLEQLWGDVPSYDAMAKLDAEHEKLAAARRKQAEKGIAPGADE